MNSEHAVFLQQVPAIELGLDPQRWSAALQFAQQLVSTQVVPAISFEFQRAGKTTGPQSFGSRELHREIPIDPDTRFLIASLTKPMVAMATLLLVERGQLALNERVSEIVPEFKGPGKRLITVKHLLTHTSGLPDMLPNNRELRASHATLHDFVRETGQTEIVYPSGTNSQYQSMGYALLGAIIEKVCGRSCSQFLQEDLFHPLGMHRSSLGLAPEEINDPNVAIVEVPEDQVGEDSWNWNSPYWKSFGAPWGGTLASVSDVSRFCRCMLNGGLSASGKRLFHETTICHATSNRLHDYPDLPESIRRTRGWGYGWRMNWMDHRGSFGDLLGPDVFGHWGATGTVCWIDPKTQSALVILSTKPYDRAVSPLVLLSNLISSAASC